MTAGKFLLAHGRGEEGEAAAQRMLEADPQDAEAHCNLGASLDAQGKLERSAASFARAIELRPGFAAAHTRLGYTLLKLAQVEESVASFRRALEIEPGSAIARAGLIMALDVHAGASLAEQQGERRRWYEDHGLRFAGAAAPFRVSRDPRRRLRVGYVSADFRAHSAAFTFGPLIRNRDPAQFEVFCYSDVRKEDRFSTELKGAADAWRATLGVPDEDLAAAIRADGIDILVDLSAHTGDRLRVFARRPAPIQMTGWGYATGTGIATIDYMFADPISVPPAVRPLFAEEIIDLPCCLCYEPPKELPAVSELPAAAGAPFTFGCINSAVKLSAQVIALWSRILAAMPHARLLLKSAHFDHASIRERIVRDFGAKGIGGERLLIRGSSSFQDHLGALQGADIALDPLPMTGGVSTMETLLMGVPVVTLLGATTPGRISASILTALGMPDWIAQDEDEYLRIALEMSEDLAHLARIRQEMRARIAGAEIFDGPRYVRRVENAYREAWRRWCREAA